MPTLTYPSRDFPPAPTIRMPLPEGWSALPSGVAPGAVLAAVRQAQPGEFANNIVVTVSSLPSGHTPAMDLDAVESVARERRNGVAGQSYLRTLGPLTFVGRDISWVDHAAGTLLSSNLFGYVRHEGSGLLDRIEVTTTIGANDHVAAYAQVHGIVDALDITPSAGTVGLSQQDAPDAVDTRDSRDPVDTRDTAQARDAHDEQEA